MKEGTLRPLVKWCGGKSKMADKILEMLPKGKRLVEPFVGSAAVSIASDYNEFLWNDTAIPLIVMYDQVIRHPDEVNMRLKALVNRHQFTEDGYYEARADFNAEITQVNPQTAALLMYLNKTGFNGLFRMNKKGEFNVPWGKRTSASFPEREDLILFSRRFSNITLQRKDYWVLFMFDLREGDVVYCDPPYVPIGEQGFTGYSGEFGKKQQEILVREAKFLAKDKGIPVLISNHYTPYTKKLYRSASRIEVFDVGRAVSCKADGRGKVQEIYALWD